MRRALLASACVLAMAIGLRAQDKPVTTEQVFTSVTLLRGIPVDTFFDAMGMFAAAMGNDCTFCHAPEAYFKKEAFATVTPRMLRARQMIVMVNTINKQFFGGQPRVTCFTCHAGGQSPRREPDLAVQYGPPGEDPNAREFPADPRFTGAQVLDRYLQAIGGATRLAQLTSFVARGTYAGFDTAFEKMPVEIYAKAPDQRTTIVRMFNGASVSTYDGGNGWVAGPETPLPLVTLTAGTLARARLEAVMAFPAAIAKAFPQWRVGRTAIEDREVQIVQGRDETQPRVNLYFDKEGLLVRMVTWTATPVGIVPTQFDYSDYREIALSTSLGAGGIRMPFKWTVTQTYMQAHVELSEVQANATIDPSRFARPTPASR
jgi:hypothetical protein